MTIKQRWKELCRARRVMRREARKTMADMLALGTGAMMVKKGVDPRHIPIVEMMKLRAVDRVINPPILVDPNISRLC